MIELNYGLLKSHQKVFLFTKGDFRFQKGINIHGHVLHKINLEAKVRSNQESTRKPNMNKTKKDSTKIGKGQVSTQGLTRRVKSRTALYFQKKVVL